MGFCLNAGLCTFLFDSFDSVMRMQLRTYKYQPPFPKLIKLQLDVIRISDVGMCKTESFLT